MEASNRDRPSALEIALLLASLAAAGVGQYCLAYKWQVNYAAVLWPLALVLFVAALSSTPREHRELPRLSGESVSRPWEAMLATAVIALGIFFKVHKLQEFPPGLNHDAAWEGQYALAILNGIPYTPFVSAAWGRETLTFYLRAPFVWWLGNVPLAVYLPSVIAGSILLPFLYWWARTMFGRTTAILTTALLGVSGWSLVFSRTGWRSDFQPLFTVLTCCFFWRGLERRRPLHFALAGVSLAATVNTYNAGQVLPLLFLIWIPLFALQGWTLQGFLRRYGWALGSGAVAFLVAVAPLAWYALNNWEKFFGRQTYLLQQWSFARSLGATVLMFHYWANGDDFFVNTPGLESVAAVFFPFGLLWCCAAVRDPRAQFLLVGFAVGLLPGLLSRPNMNRDIGTMPFVYFFAALGTLFCARQLARLAPRQWRRAFIASAAAVIVGASAWATYAQYLGPSRRLVWGYYPETTVLGQYLATLVPSYRIWVLGGHFPMETLEYLTYREGDPFKRSFTQHEDPARIFREPLPDPSSSGLAFVFPDETVAMLVMAELRSRYPKHEIVNLRYPTNESGRIFARVLLVPPTETVPTVDTAMVRQRDPTRTPLSLASPTPTEVPSLAEPRGVAVFDDGTIVVSDFGHDRLVWFDSALRRQRALGQAGHEPGQFRQPSGLAIGPGNELYVCDTWNHRIQVLTKSGEYRRQYLANFFSPRGVAVARDGTVYVADSGNNRVVVLRADGEVVQSWDGSAGGSPLREPVGIAVDDRRGVVFVTDNGQAKVRIFSSSGESLGSFALEGISLQALSEPQLSWASQGGLWVNVTHRHEVRLYKKTGDLAQAIPVISEEGKEKLLPMGVAEDYRRKRLLVTTLQGDLLSIPLGGKP